jgi:hypothetical protein
MLILNRPLDDGAARIRSGQVVELKPASSSRFELSWTRIRLEGLPDTTDPARRGTELQDCPDQRHLGEDEQPFDESISMEVDGRVSAFHLRTSLRDGAHARGSGTIATQAGRTTPAASERR